MLHVSQVLHSVCKVAGMNVLYTSEARAGLAQLEVDDTRLGEVVNRELDAFESDPTLTRWRARGYAGVTPRAWGFVVRGATGEALVLWSESPDPDVTIWHIGTALLAR